MIKTDKISVRYHDYTVGTLSLSPDSKLCVFEYDRRWLVDGFSISPLELPLKESVFIAKPIPFQGNFGIFEDSLPDGYGRYLLHKALQRQGIDDKSFSALDRLSLVGESGMGALSYFPILEVGDNNELTNDFDLLQEKALEVLKEKQSDDAEMLLYNSGNSGGARPKAVFSDNEGHWLVKFRHCYDPKDIGLQEFKYNEIAKECGINVPDFKLINGKYFATRRFDISPEGERIHSATAGGLLGISHSTPVLDYENLLALTGYLTQNPDEVEEMFRRMVFNYLTGNKDDHSKNFSFLAIKEKRNKWEWHLAPAYDLTLCAEGYNGEHSTSVNGTGTPTLSDFIAVGTKLKIKETRCREIVSNLREICKPILYYSNL